MLKKDHTIFFRTIFKITFLFLTLNVFGQTISDKTFGIAEFSNKDVILNVFKNKHTSTNFGMSIKIYRDATSNVLELQLSKGSLKFDVFLEVLKHHLADNRNQVFPLFLEFRGNDKELIKEIEKANLLELVYYQSNGERWPSIEEIVKKGKQLILFKDGVSDKVINSISNQIFDISKPLDLQFTQTDLENEFLMVKHFTTKGLLKNRVPLNWNNISVNLYAIKHLIKQWETTGKQPNFVFYSSDKFVNTFYYLSNLLNNTSRIKGQVTEGDKVLNGVSWGHQNNSFTGGYFSFPYNSGEELILRPFREGYVFSPKEVNVSAKKITNLEFQSKELSITEGITANYKFNNNLFNEARKEKLNGNSPVFVSDKKKGTVLKIENKNFIKLDKIKEYGIVNSSFTIAIDVKYTSVTTHNNYSILGNDEVGYRKGLHVNIFDGKLFFGFYTNDTKLNFKVSPDTWHKLVVKYNFNTKAQSIYIDGEKIGASNNHPSFIGGSNLLLGCSIKQKNYFTGYLDNLQIWKRPLSDKEISWISENNISLKETKQSNFQYLPIMGICILFLVVLGGIHFYRKNKNVRQIQIPVREKELKIVNTIQLFGQFKLYNDKGKDLSGNFSPKIKELFLLILIWTIKNNKGITTRELTEILWEGFTSSKAANNRGVSFNVLKKVLKDTQGIKVVYENKLWRVVLDEYVFVDYEWVCKFIKERKTDYNTLFEIVNKGVFLSDAKTDWFLEEKTNLNFDLLDVLSVYVKEEFKSGNYINVIQLTDYIQKIDDLNIQALYYQLHCLSKEGSKNKMNYLFDSFCQKYKTINSISFKYELLDFLNEDIENLW